MNHSATLQTKICGITRIEDATCCVAAGADAIGLNFYRGSKRYVEPEIAADIVQFHGTDIATVGVFVNSTHDEIESIVKEVGLSHVQFHGDERRELMFELKNSLPGVQFIRAIRIVDGNLTAAQSEIDQWTAAEVDMILLDAASVGEFGGTGKRLDWSRLDQLRFERPWLLAGGLDPDVVGDAIRIARPDGVDVASGVEEAPGVKDHELIERFMMSAIF